MSPTVVGDTSPFLYLHRIGHIELLPALFETVHIPKAVHDELCHLGAPNDLRKWALAPPFWLCIHNNPAVHDPATLRLDAGESAAITLAESLHARLILIDERKGSRICQQKGFEVTGTLGILAIAARRGLVDLAEAFEQIKQTNFRYNSRLLQQILDRHARGE